MRDSMIFYRSFYEAIKNLTPDMQAEIYNAIFTYGLDFKEPELKGISLTIWTLIKPQLDANIKRFENGNKPKHKQNESKTEAKQKQNESKTKANNNVNVNDNVNDNVNVNNIDFRKLKFSEQIKTFVNTYPESLLKNFYNYWSEPNKSKTKFRMELEKTWDLERRLKTWAINDKNFNKTLKNGTIKQTAEQQLIERKQEFFSKFDAQIES
jgi:hypothetical protein